MVPPGREKMVPTSRSETEREHEDGGHQSLSPESIPAGSYICVLNEKPAPQAYALI